MNIYRTKFKAKGIDDGKWHFGGVCCTEHWASIFEVYHECGYGDYDPPYEDIEEIDVDIKTLCQCTGEKDKHQDLIYESDIVDYNGKLFVVVFMDEVWCLVEFKEFSHPEMDYDRYIVLAEIDCKQSSITGNVFD